MEAAILDDALRPLPPETPGEIALSGAQLAKGYFGQPELTQERFPVIDGKRWYLTGDLGMQDKSQGKSGTAAPERKPDDPSRAPESGEKPDAPDGSP